MLEKYLHRVSPEQFLQMPSEGNLFCPQSPWLKYEMHCILVTLVFPMRLFRTASQTSPWFGASQQSVTEKVGI